MSKTQQAYRDRPIKLVNITDNGIFETTPEGISFLSSLKNQSIAVLSVTGPYRSGKSFLANLLMNNMGGFKVGSTISACTKGLWVWGRPIELPKGRKLIILDSEGLGSVEKDRTNNIDMKIFTLSVLLSSCLLYNTKHAISEDKIEELSNVANLSKRINISKDKKENLNLDFGDFFPDLIWVLRDFSLDKGNYTAKDYLEQCLAKVDTSKIPGGESKNICREIITKNFKHRDCFTLVVPVTDEAKLRNLDNEPQSSLRKEFMNQVSKMIGNIKETIKPKKINNIEIDGESLFSLLQTYVESINNKENPVILSALENVLLSKAKSTSETVFENFKETINKKLKDLYPTNESKIYNLFFEEQNSLVKNFCKNIKDSLSSEQTGTYIIKLFERMTDELGIILENNLNSYEEYINSEKENISRQMRQKNFQKIEETKLYLLDLSNQVSSLLNQFIDLESTNEQSKKLLTVISNILQEKLFDNLRRFGKTLEEIYTNKISTYQNTLDDLKLKNKSISNELEQEKKISELKEKEVSDTKIKTYELESKLDTVKRKNKEKEKEFLNNINTELQKYSKMENSYMALLQEKDDRINVLELQISKLGTKNSKESNELSKENVRLQYELKKLKENKNINNNNNLNNVSLSYIDQNTLELSNILNNFQDNVKMFRDSVNKMNYERDNLFKEQYIQKMKEDVDSKTKNWGNEIINVIKAEFSNMSNNYDETLENYKHENERLLKENSLLKQGIEDGSMTTASGHDQTLKRQMNEILYINSSKDATIKAQDDLIKMKVDEVEKLKEIKNDNEIKIAELKGDFIKKENEIEEIYSMLDGIFSKKKDKYDSHFNAVSEETQKRFTELKKRYKFKLS